VSVERGYDPRDFLLLAFGGGGPVHACAVADDIGITTIAIPALPGLFSAYGLLAADVRVVFARSLVVPADAHAWTTLAATFAELRSQADGALAEQTVAPDARTFAYELDLRYAGQSFELTVDDVGSPEAAVAAFHRLHARRFGFNAIGDPVELVTVRVIALGATRKPALLEPAAIDARPIEVNAARTTRDVWYDDAFVSTPVLARDALAGGQTFAGPAIVEQYDTTTFVAPGWRAHIDTFANLMLTRSGR
jgi:N-methylhydantoinase A